MHLTSQLLRFRSCWRDLITVSLTCQSLEFSNRIVTYISISDFWSRFHSFKREKKKKKKLLLVQPSFVVFQSTVLRPLIPSYVMSTLRILARSLRSLRTNPTLTSSHRIISTGHRILNSPRGCAVISSSTLRPFSTTPIQRHGHITPPKPGEEYDPSPYASPRTPSC